MLSYLPALLLLLLHGPSNIERLAHEGRLPEALSMRVDAEPGSHRSVVNMLRSSGDPSLVRALAILFSTEETAPTPTPQAPVISNAQTLIPSAPAFELAAGFAKGCRTRDGPANRMA
jgi:hypothetical protein